MSAQHCPTCHAEFDPAQSSTMPFCSERCRLLDLGRWLDERYSVPASRLSEEDDGSQDLESHHDEP